MNLVIVFLIAMAVMSVVTFILFGIDKWKAVHGKWRISEATLLVLSLLFGGVGGLLGMFVFRHKVRKRKFQICIPVFVILQLTAVGYCVYLYR